MNLNTLPGQFIGKREIAEAQLAKEDTYLGNRRIKVGFENDEVRCYPEDILEVIVTEEQSTPTDLREAWCMEVANRVLAILTETEIPKGYVHYLVSVKLNGSINMHYAQALKEMWGKPREEVNLMDVELTLRNAKEQQENQD